MTSDLVSVLEVGTTRTALLAGRAAEGGGIEVAAFAEQETTGMRKGCVAEPDYVARAVRTVRETAETQLRGGEIVDAALVCSLGETSCEPIRGEVPVSGEDGRVDDEDVRRAREALAAEVPSVPGRHVLGDAMSLFFTLDGNNEEVREPRDMSAGKLAMHGMALSVNEDAWDLLCDSVARGGLNVNFELFSGIAAAVGCLSPQKMEDGTLCLCLGGGTTCWCAYRRRHPIAAGAIPVGGDHVTNDLLSAFRPGSALLAGRLKTEFGRADPDAVDPASRIQMPQDVGGTGRTVGERAVAQVIHARLDETLRLVKADLESRGVLPWLGGGVVVAGGGALMPGVDALVSRTFGAPCEHARLNTGIPELDGRPELNAAIWGGLCKAIRNQRREAARNAAGGVKGFFRKLFSQEGEKE